MSALKLFKVSIAGALAGALLAVATPQTALTAHACKCDDFGSSQYACNLDQDACVEGTELCFVSCS